MSKQIKVPDELHAKIKAEADKNYRSIVGQLEFYAEGGRSIVERAQDIIADNTPLSQEAKNIVMRELKEATDASVLADVEAMPKYCVINPDNMVVKKDLTLQGAHAYAKMDPNGDLTVIAQKV